MTLNVESVEIGERCPDIPSLSTPQSGSGSDPSATTATGTLNKDETLTALLSLFSAQPAHPTTQGGDEHTAVNLTENFVRRITAILSPALPAANSEEVRMELLRFFELNMVCNEASLGCLNEKDVPKTKKVPWSARAFRRAIQDLVHCCKVITAHGYYFPSPAISIGTVQSVAAYAHLPKQPILPATPSPTSAPPSSPQKSRKYEISDVQDIKIPIFSGSADKLRDWNKDVAHAFGTAGVHDFLHDSALCLKYDTVSYSLTCSLNKAIEKGTASHLNVRHQDERNVCTFYKLIQDNYDIRPNLRVLEFKEWINLFTLKLDSIDDFEEYVNQYQTAVSELTKYKSSAVHDAALMRALLLHSVRAEEFSDVKLQINKQFNLAPKDIVSHLRAHHLAINTDDNLTNKKPSGKTTAGLKSRRGKTGAIEKSPSRIECPRFPNGLRESIGKSVWGQLCKWKMLFNRPNKSEDDEKTLRAFKITAGKKADASSYKQNKPAYSKDRSQYRSGKDTRHDDSRRRASRRTNRYSSRSFSPSSSRSRSASSTRSDRYDQRAYSRSRSRSPVDSKRSCLRTSRRSRTDRQSRARTSDRSSASRSRSHASPSTKDNKGKDRHVLFGRQNT